MKLRLASAKVFDVLWVINISPQKAPNRSLSPYQRCSSNNLFIIFLASSLMGWFHWDVSHSLSARKIGPNLYKWAADRTRPIALWVLGWEFQIDKSKQRLRHFPLNGSITFVKARTSVALLTGNTGAFCYGWLMHTMRLDEPTMSEKI